METMEQLYIPQLQQFKAKTLSRDATRCFATFDGTVCDGDMIVVKASDHCLITRYRLHMKRDLELVETHFRSLCIMSYSPNCAYGMPVGEPGPVLGDSQVVSVFIQPRSGHKRELKKGGLYEATRITYLPEYFDEIDLPFIGNFEDIATLIPSLDDELLSLHLRGLLEDLDFDAAQKPSGRYYFRSIALQALCHVMDMVYELNRLYAVGIDGRDLRLVRQVMEIVESSLDRIPTIKELSGMLYVGHTQLCETFKDATGMTIGEYARKRRIETAKVLLRDPDIPIKEISRRIGYQTTGGFSSTFKQLVGATPRQYRLANMLAGYRAGAGSGVDELDF